MLTLHVLRIELGKSYRQTIDLLSEMPGVLEEVGLTRLPHFTVLRHWFEKLPTKTWRAFLRRRTEKHTGHAAIDSTGFDRDRWSRYYTRRAHYRVRALKVTALVDVETLYITDIQSRRNRKVAPPYLLIEQRLLNKRSVFSRVLLTVIREEVSQK